MPILRIVNGSLKAKVFSIGEKELSIGSDQDNDICIPDMELESRHAVVFTVGEMCFIRDLKSKRGTFVNHVRIVEELLYTGDKIKIGSVNIIFEDTNLEPKDTVKELKYDEEDDQSSGAVMELDIERSKEDRDDFEKDETEILLRNLGVINSFTQEVSQIKERDQLLQLVMKTISKNLQVDNVYVFLKDRQGDLVPRAVWEREKTKVAPVSRGIIRRVIKNNKTIMTKDAASDARFRENLSIVKRKVKGVICAPLISRQQIHGVIYTGTSGASQMFVSEDMELLTTIANVASVVLDNLRSHRKQSSLLMNMMRSLVTTMELAIPNNIGHSMRVASYAGAIAREKSLNSKKIYICQLGGYLHDIGKIATNQMEGNTEEEKEKNYRQHVETGERILFEMEGMEELIPAVKYHHEFYDGSGFPEGLKEESIPMIARIVGLANYLDHLINQAKKQEETIEFADVVKEIKELAGKKFHPDDVMALREAHRNGHLKIAETWLHPNPEGI